MNEKEQAAIVVAFLFVVFVVLWPNDEKRALAPDVVKQSTADNASATPQDALVNAANNHKIKPVLLLAISQIETAGTFSVSIRPKRKSGKFIGTARGLCQFIKTTARYYKLDWATNDPDKQAKACAQLTRDSQRQLKARLGRSATNGEVYLAHVFGLGKAIRIIRAKGTLSVVKTIGKKDLRANRFLAKYKNAAGIRAWAERKMGRAIKRMKGYVSRPPAVAGWVRKKEDDELWINRNNRVIFIKTEKE